MGMIERVKSSIYVPWRVWMFIPFIALMALTCIACGQTDEQKMTKTISDVGSVRGPGRMLIPDINDAERFGLVPVHSGVSELHGLHE